MNKLNSGSGIHLYKYSYNCNIQVKSPLKCWNKIDQIVGRVLKTRQIQDRTGKKNNGLGLNFWYTHMWV